jgi:hypothetical protein
MKFLAVIALVAVAVAAETYKVNVKLPCEYEVKIKMKSKGVTADFGKTYVNGRYMKSETEVLGKKSITLYRPDINKKEGDTEKIASVSFALGVCTLDYVDVKTIFPDVDEEENTMYFENKEKQNYGDEKCTAYWNGTSIDKDGGIFVCDDELRCVRAVLAGETTDTIMEYEYDAPMEKFVIKEDACTKIEKKLAEEPSEDFIMCAASSVKVAFVALLVALVSALF